MSNNDGCAISRTDEAKAMGIAMGAPWFQIKHLESLGLVGLSANFPLYGHCLQKITPTRLYGGRYQRIHSHQPISLWPAIQRQSFGVFEHAFFRHHCSLMPTTTGLCAKKKNQGYTTNWNELMVVQA